MRDTLWELLNKMKEFDFDTTDGEMAVVGRDMEGRSVCVTLLPEEVEEMHHAMVVYIRSPRDLGADYMMGWEMAHTFSRMSEQAQEPLTVNEVVEWVLDDARKLSGRCCRRMDLERVTAGARDWMLAYKGAV